MNMMEGKDDAISRRAAIEVLNKLARDNFTLNDAFAFYLGALHDAADEIKALPSARPRRLRGRWVETERRGVLAGAKYYKCNICAQAIVVVDSTPMTDGYNYCPRCGSQMEEGQDG